MTSNQREPCFFLETAICTIILALVAVIWILRLSAPFPINYGEGPLLDQAVRLANFKNIYQPIGNTPPWTVSNYPPLFPLLNVPFIWIFGPAFWYGRLISMLAALTSTWLVQEIAKRLGASNTSARFGAIIFLSSYPIFMWSTLMRVDALALALALLAIYKSLSQDFKSSDRWQVIAALVLAAMTRWINLIFPAVAVTLILTNRVGLKRALNTIGSTFLLLTLLLAAGSILTHGWLWFHIVSSNVNPWQLRRAMDVIARASDLSPSESIIFIATIFSLFVYSLRQRRLIYLLLLTSLSTAIAAGKIGSDLNYVFDLAATLGICGALLISNLNSRHLRQAITFSLGLLSCIVVEAFASSNYLNFTDPNLATNIRDLNELIRSHSGRVIADELMGMEVVNGFPLIFQPFEMTMLTRQEKWSEQSLITAIDQKQIRLAIIESDNTSRRFNERWSESIKARILGCPHQRFYVKPLAIEAYDLSNPDCSTIMLAIHD